MMEGNFKGTSKVHLPVCSCILPMKEVTHTRTQEESEAVVSIDIYVILKLEMHL